MERRRRRTTRARTLDRQGLHAFAIQEAHAEQMAQLHETHNFVLEQNQLWNDATYDIFEKRCILPVADWSDECCFVAIRESFVKQVLVKGSSWGHWMEK